jgi:hypothetical protein
MDQVGSLLDRPKLYYNVDGVGELGIAVLLLGCAVLGWGQVRTSEHSFWNRGVTFPVYFLLLIAVIHFGSKAIKKYITYPRTGRVEYRMSDVVWRPMMISFVVSAVASAGIAWAVKSHRDLSTAVPLLGLILAATYANGFAKGPRWKWSVVWVMAAASIAIALLPAEAAGSFAEGSWLAAQIPPKLIGAVWLTETVYGLLLLVSGGISFCLYLRQTSAPPADAE